jgi:hypothetical protein
MGANVINALLKNVSSFCNSFITHSKWDLLLKKKNIE